MLYQRVVVWEFIFDGSGDGRGVGDDHAVNLHHGEHPARHPVRERLLLVAAVYGAGCRGWYVGVRVGVKGLGLRV